MRKAIYILIWLSGLAGFCFAYLEPEHRSFEGWPATILLSAIAVFFSVLWVATMKFVRVESGGVYGRQHDQIVRAFGTAWRPLKLGMIVLGLVGLGSVVGGAVTQQLVSTQGITVLAASGSAFLLCHYFETKSRH